MIHFSTASDSSPLRQEICRAYLADETTRVKYLLEAVAYGDAHTVAIANSIGERARQLIASIRRQAQTSGGIDALLREYDLSTHEGVALMCMAEALLRHPVELGRLIARLIDFEIEIVDESHSMADGNTGNVQVHTIGGQTMIMVDDSKTGMTFLAEHP